MEIYRGVSIPEHVREAMCKAELSGRHWLAWQIRTEFQPGYKRLDEYAEENNLPGKVRTLLRRADARVRHAARRYQRILRQAERFRQEQASLVQVENALNAKFDRQIEAEALRAEHGLKPRYPGARRVVEERKRLAQ